MQHELVNTSEIEMARVSMMRACSGARVPGGIAACVPILRLSVVILGAVSLYTPAAAQQLAAENPDALRPPTLLSYPLASRQREVVRLYFAELTHALQNGDATALSALVPDSVIPAAEKLNARLTGCASLGAAIIRLRARVAATGGLRSVALDEVAISPAGQGDTVAFGAAQLRAGGFKSDFSVALTRSGHARSMARVRGLLLALCTTP